MPFFQSDSRALALAPDQHRVYRVGADEDAEDGRVLGGLAHAPVGDGYLISERKRRLLLA